jgi:hypothetical protein
MAVFPDSARGLWAKGALNGKVGGAFASIGAQHGGQEMTLFSIIANPMDFGMVIVGLDHGFAGQPSLAEMTGGGPHGATTIADGDGSRRRPKTSRPGRVAKARGSPRPPRNSLRLAQLGKERAWFTRCERPASRRNASSGHVRRSLPTNEGEPLVRRHFSASDLGARAALALGTRSGTKFLSGFRANGETTPPGLICHSCARACRGRTGAIEASRPTRSDRIGVQRPLSSFRV